MGRSWQGRMSINRQFKGGTVKWFRRRQAPKDQPNLVQTVKGNPGPCQCDPQWPDLETEANGYLMPAVRSNSFSPITAGVLGELEARCVGCHATYPEAWVLAPDTPPPFAWAHEDDA